MEFLSKNTERVGEKEMDMLQYCIDNLNLEINENRNAILIVQGWAFSKRNCEVTINFNYNFPYRIMWFKRDDLASNFPDTNAVKGGFQLEIVLTKKIRKLYCFFSDLEDQTAYVIDIVKIIGRQKFLINKGISDTLKKYCLSGSTNGEKRIFYSIDALYYKEKLNVDGWAFSDGEDVEIITNDFNASVEKIYRSDVFSAFMQEYSITERCGFHIEIDRDCISSEGLKLFFETSNEDKIGFCLATEIVEQMNSLAVPMVENETIKQKILEYALFKKNSAIYGKEGARLKKHEYEIFMEENLKNTKPYVFEPYYIPKEWIDIQKTKSTISIVIAINEVEEKKKYIEKMLQSIRKQIYQTIEVILVGKDVQNLMWDNLLNVKCVDEYFENKYDALYKGVEESSGRYLIFMDQEDIIDPVYLALGIENINENKTVKCIYCDYDIAYNEEPFIKVEREECFWKKENESMILTACFIQRECIESCKNYLEIAETIRGLNKKYLFHETRIAYHYSAVDDSFGRKNTKLIAFYLTQYHITEENNKWWGEGFTEWVNVKRGVPMFEGHNQPRVPGDLGYYDLVEDPSIQYKQIEMAKSHDIYGFCYYYYWFEGKRLLRKPLDQFLENKDLRLPFCICWANETWSKRWDGQEHEVLMKQVHNRKTDEQFIKEMLPMFKDERYIKIDGEPLLLVYRIELFPQPYQTIKRWRKTCKENGFKNIHVAIVQSFGIVNPKIYGADSAVEFPPHKIVGNRINEKVLPKGSDFSGNIYSYKEIVDNLSTISGRDYSMMAGSMLGWDNTARRLNASNIFAEFSPELYRRWLIRNHYYTKIYRNDSIMFVNAWNEWAEGTYLEPDLTYGTTFLEITKEVVRMK